MFTIPRWPDDSDYKHYETTWVLAKNMDKDKDRNLLVNGKVVTITDDKKLVYNGKTYDPNNNPDDLEELRSYGFVDVVVRSDKYLIAWDPNYDVPVGTVWYIAALRHLKDKDGNDIGNDVWIGPDPAINKNSFKNEFFATKLNIEAPYISNFTYVPGEKIDMTLPLPKSNVFYLNTALVITDRKGEILFSNFYNLKDTENKIVIDNKDLDFDKYDIIIIKLWHIGNHSTISPEYSETFLLKKVYFNVLGRKTDIDPYTVNELVVTKTSTTSVEVEKATIMTQDKQLLASCQVVDKEIIKIPNNVLNFNTSYIIKLDLKITYDNGKTDNIDYYVPITTKSYKEEVTQIVEDYMYKNELTEIKNYNSDTSFYTVDTKYSCNTEEFFTYLIPMLDKDKKALSLYIFGRQDKALSRFKENVLDFYNDVTIRLLKRNYGYMQMIDSDNGQLRIRKFNYDSYKDTLNIELDFTLDIKNVNNNMRKIIELSRGYYICGVDKDNSKKLIIYKWNPKLNETDIIATKELSYDIEDIAFVEWGENLGLIYTKATDGSRFYVFSTNNNNIEESISIPSSFRNKQLYLERLKNGNIIGIKLNDSDDPLDYFIIDYKEQKIKQYHKDYKGNGHILHGISMKNGDVILYMVEENTVRIFRYN